MVIRLVVQRVYGESMGQRSIVPDIKFTGFTGIHTNGARLRRIGVAKSVD